MEGMTDHIVLESYDVKELRLELIWAATKWKSHSLRMFPGMPVDAAGLARAQFVAAEVNRQILELKISELAEQVEGLRRLIVERLGVSDV